MTERIASVPPLAEDAGTIGTWLKDRRQAERSLDSAALAFGLHKFERSYKLIDRANQADASGLRAISGFGFQVCGVAV